MPLGRSGRLKQQPHPVQPARKEPLFRPRPDVSRAQSQIEVPIEKNLGLFHVAGPAPEEVDVVPIMSATERFEVVTLQAFAGEVTAFRPNLLSRLSDEEAHACGRPREIRIRKIDADGAGGAADSESVVDEMRHILDAAAANDFGPENAAAAVAQPRLQRGQ